MSSQADPTHHSLIEPADRPAPIIVRQQGEFAVSPEATQPADVPTAFIHYFVDEGGDPTLFNGNGTVIVGRPGCSRFFILGVLEVPDPQSLAADLEALRGSLLSSPALAGIASMQPRNRKTAVMFHAKDDCKEVRREVFSLLRRQQVSFSAVVRHKELIAALYDDRPRPMHYRPNRLYDTCTSALFTDMLTSETCYRIVFAQRGNSQRTSSLEHALENAREQTRSRLGNCSSSAIEVDSCRPNRQICLQASDYFVWALQRLYERGDDEAWNWIQDKVVRVIDRDLNWRVDLTTRGVVFDSGSPLTLSRLACIGPGI